jgi:hypothetical protein
MISDGCWEGARVFVVGGGPSLRTFDWKRLEGENVIGANFSCPAPTVSLVNDARIVRTESTLERWRQMPGEKIFCERQGLEAHEAPFARRVPAVEYWSGSIADGLVTANNCGLAALNLADLTHPRVIYLLGFDFRGVAGRTANSHSIYPADWETSSDAYTVMLDQWRRRSVYCVAPVVELSAHPVLTWFLSDSVDNVI